MKKSLATRFGKIIKKIICVQDFSLFKKNLHKKIGKLIYHKKYSSQDLVRIMVSMGMTKGSVVCIHSSMKEFYNYTGTATEFIEKILEIITSDGTLIMPAFPAKELIKEPNYIFDLSNRTGAGFLAETFRKYPGVKRSINVQHSVCAIGKYADWLLKDHHLCHDCWDKNSPWQRMIQLNAIVFNLGLPRSYIGTFHHCVESVLQFEHPYWAQFFTREVEYTYYNENNEICRYKSMEGELDRRTREKRVTKYFTNQDWQIRKISNLEIKAFYTKNCFPKMLALGRRGIGVYYVPTPQKYKF